MNATLRTIIAVLFFGSLLGCAKEVTSEEQARRAYLGLDSAVGKAIQLGFDGYNAASSANIPDQTTNGTASGTLTIAGRVDAGVSTNKVMNLSVAMTNYSDGQLDLAGEKVAVTYATSTDVTVQPLPALDLTLHNIPSATSDPNGSFDGTLVGPFQMTGDLTGDVTLNLALTGSIENDGSGNIRRVAGSTQVTGTATAGDGVYNVDITL